MTRSDFQPVPIDLIFHPAYIRDGSTRGQYLVDRVIEGPSGEALIQNNVPTWIGIPNADSFGNTFRLTNIDFAASGKSEDAHERFDDAWAALGRPTHVYADGASRDPRGITLSYWVFYPFNQAYSAPNDVGNHEGDWEHVDVNLDPLGRPKSITLSAHEGGTTIPWFGTRDRRGVLRRPGISSAGRSARINVARGTHANYVDCTPKVSFAVGVKPLRVEVKDDPCYDAHSGDVGGPYIWDRGIGKTTMSRFGSWVCADAIWGAEGSEVLGYGVGNPPRSPWFQSEVLRAGDLGPKCQTATASGRAMTRSAPRPVPGGDQPAPVSGGPSEAVVLPGAGVVETTSRCASYEPRAGGSAGAVEMTLCSPALLDDYVGSGYDERRFGLEVPELVPAGGQAGGGSGAPDQGLVDNLADVAKVEIRGGRTPTAARLFLTDCTKCETGEDPRWVSFDGIVLRPSGPLSRYRLTADAQGVTLRAAGRGTVTREWQSTPPPTR